MTGLDIFTFAVMLVLLAAVAVRLKFDSGVQPVQLSSGANGAVAIYTGSGKPLRIIRKVIIRMFTWMNFLP